jgi:hypothetical protein
MSPVVFLVFSSKERVRKRGFEFSGLFSALWMGKARARLQFVESMLWPAKQSGFRAGDWK